MQTKQSPQAGERTQKYQTPTITENMILKKAGWIKIGRDYISPNTGVGFNRRVALALARTIAGI